MSVNLTSKYSSKIDERFSHSSFTDIAAGHDYEFSGVKEISIYDVSTVSNTDYTRSGVNRYGNSLTDLNDQLQTLSIAKDRAFQFSVDAGNDAQQMNIKRINDRMKVQWDEVCTPEIDTYRLAAWATGKGLAVNGTPLTDFAGNNFGIQNHIEATFTKTNALEAIFKANAKLDNKLVPAANRYLYIPVTTYVQCKIASEVIGAGAQTGKEAIAQGYKGMLDGLKVVAVPDAIWPTVTAASGTNELWFMIKYAKSTVDPMQLKNLRVHRNPMGVDGDVAQGRYIYDSFVLTNKCNGICICTKVAANVLASN